MKSFLKVVKPCWCLPFFKGLTFIHKSKCGLETSLWILQNINLGLACSSRYALFVSAFHCDLDFNRCLELLAEKLFLIIPAWVFWVILTLFLNPFKFKNATSVKVWILAFIHHSIGFVNRFLLINRNIGLILLGYCSISFIFYRIFGCQWFFENVFHTFGSLLRLNQITIFVFFFWFERIFFRLLLWFLIWLNNSGCFVSFCLFARWTDTS